MTCVLVAMLAASPLLQAPRDARVTVTVVDQTQAVVPNATVTVTALEPPAGSPAIEPIKSNDKGVATLQGLVPGRYKIVVEFPGFETRTLPDVRMRAGENRHVAVLAIQGLQDSVTVSRDAREAASDRRSTFATAMTREQIEALSDDPTEMAQQLQDIAGGNATIRVDSFEGGRLPPKSAIKAIHITRDAFAAENHFAGGLFIDIITQPGLGPLRTNMNFRMRAGKLSGTPPALPDGVQQQRGPERNMSYNGGIGGSLIKQKASFSISANQFDTYDTPYFHYYLPDGTLVEGLAPRRMNENMFIFGLFDYAITRDQTLRFNFSREQSNGKNLGIGQTNMLERGYNNESGGNTLRIQEAGPIGRRFFINTRANINWYSQKSVSLFEGPTVIVLEEFNAGGQQRKGGVTTKSLNLQSDLDYVRGMHSVRTGIQLDAGSYHSDDWQNYLGTYTFTNTASYNLGLPRSYTIRTGDPNIRYKNLQAGWYLQDDIRVRRNLTLSPGVRYEAQTHLSDYNNFGPRFGFTWSPGKAGVMTLRASAGIFYDWLSTGTYEQTLRVDGERQKQLNVMNPSYPYVDDGTSKANAIDKYLLSSDLQMQRNTRFSGGIDRGITRMIRVNATYAYTLGSSLMRGENLNGPTNGVRPDPAFANVVQVVGDAESRQHNFNVGASINFNVTSAPGGGGPVMIGGGERMIMLGAPPPPPPPAGSAAARNPANALWNWRRMQMFMNLGLNSARNNTEGAFATPATGFIADDWGPSNFDVRRRFNVSWSSSQLRNFNANINFNASSAAPYTIRAGIDRNGDLVFNDRPEGIGRNTLRQSMQWNTNAFFSYGRNFGKPVERAGGVSIRSEGGALTASQGAASTQGRYRMTFNMQIQNLTNHGNLGGYTGTITSKGFGKPQVIFGTRKIDFGVGLSF